MTTMQNNFNEDVPNPADNGGKKEQDTTTGSPLRQRSLFSRWMNSLVDMGLGEPLLRIGTNLFSIIAIGIVIALVQGFFRQINSPLSGNSEQATGQAESEGVAPISAPALDIPVIDGISRSAQIHTNIPNRPRNEITTYTVEDGDTVFGIAEKFGLEPQTILWGNYEILLDDPHSLRPGQCWRHNPSRRRSSSAGSVSAARCTS